jgi:hypothetical protein
MVMGSTKDAPCSTAIAAGSQRLGKFQHTEAATASSGAEIAKVMATEPKTYG